MAEAQRADYQDSGEAKKPERRAGASANELLTRMERLRSARGLWDLMFQEVRDNVIPVLARFVGQDPDGAKSNQYTVDETPEQAHELLASALVGMIMNPALKWFDLAPRNKALMEIERVAAWCYHTRDRVLEYMYTPSAGLAAAHHETCLNLTSFGTGCLYTGERCGIGLSFASRPLQEIYIAEGADGRVDTVFRWFEMTPRQAVQEFTAAGVTERIRQRADSASQQDTKLPFLHAVYPRALSIANALNPKNLPFASCYVSVDDKALIREGGYHEMPYAVPRWTKRPGETYGRGPGTKALPSCKALQRAIKITFSGAEIAIKPPLMVADDGVLGTPRLHNGGLTYVRAETLNSRRGPIEPIMNGAKPELGEDMMKGMRERIQASFYNHLLQMMRDPRMTATQVIQIAEETLRILGPMIGRIQSELLGIHVDRTLAILFRAGVLDPPPPELYGEELAVEYVSPVAQGAKLSEAKGIVQTFGVATQLANVPGAENVMDNYDLDGSARVLAVLFGMPRYLLRDPRAVQQLRAARQQKQDAAEQLANMRTAAGGMKDAATGAAQLRDALGFAPDEGGQQLANAA